MAKKKTTRKKATKKVVKKTPARKSPKRKPAKKLPAKQGATRKRAVAGGAVAHKTTRKKAAKKAVKKRTAAGHLPAQQRATAKRSAVGHCRPPVEHRFQPGRSGNPAGPPAARSNLWRWFCHWLAMTPEELRQEKKRKDLTMSQRAALKHAEQLVRKGLAGTAWLATREAWNRDEGKAAERVEVTYDNVLSEEECEAIRKAMSDE